jgi:hypothetical protein
LGAPSHPEEAQCKQTVSAVLRPNSAAKAAEVIATLIAGLTPANPLSYPGACQSRAVTGILLVSLIKPIKGVIRVVYKM